MDAPTPTDVVRRFYAAFSERDVPGVLAALDPDVVFEPVLGVLYNQHTYRGHQEIRRWCEEFAAEWDSFDTTVENAIETRGGVVAFVHLVARRGERSLDADIAVECTFSAAGRIISLTGRDAWEVAEELSVPPPSGASR
jgi:ketosteroid isomerase-like protein